MQRLSTHDIETWLSPAAVARGRPYVARGAVEITGVDLERGRVRGRVQGSARLPYEVNVRMRGTVVWGGAGVEGDCSCPVGYNCKHVAALLLAAANLPRDHHPAASLSPGVQSWLEALERADRLGRDDFPAEIDRRLLYVLGPAAGGGPHLRVETWSVRIKRDGGWTQIQRFQRENAFSRSPAKFLRGIDMEILGRLAVIPVTYGIGIDAHALSGERGAEILRRVIDSGRGHWERPTGPVLRAGQLRRGEPAWREIDGELYPTIHVEGGGVPVGVLPTWFVDPVRAEAGPLATDLPPRVAAAWLQAPAVAPEEGPLLRAALGRALPGQALPQPPGFEEVEIITGSPTPRLVLMTRFVEGRPSWRGRARGDVSETVRIARLSYRYGPIELPALDGPSRISTMRDGRPLIIERDREREAAQRRRLGPDGMGLVPVAAHLLEWDGIERHDLMLPTGSDAAWLRLVHERLPALAAEGWEITVEDGLVPALAEAEDALALAFSESSGIDWLELELGVRVDGRPVDLLPHVLSLIERARIDEDGALALGLAPTERILIPLDDGRFLPLPAERLIPIVEALWRLFRTDIGAARTLKLARTRIAEIMALEEAARAAGARLALDERLRALGTALRDGRAAAPAPLPDWFAASLRPYQADGVAWLGMLGAAGLGGLLADEMGLGKTVQMLAHLAAEKAAGRADRPSLVVMPTSLIGNWQAEAERFARGLAVLVLHGPERTARFAEIGRHDLVLTTYALLPRDRETLAAQPWHAVVLDEAQAVKNPSTHAAQIARGLDARQRFCLTGTPVQNHLGELWAAMDFAVPGLLGERTVFARQFRTPIEKQGDAARRDALLRRIRPFVLRRAKSLVAGELPPKTEIVEPVEMERGQAALYEAIRLAMYDKVHAAIAKRGVERSRIVILDALLKLRQVCCDPRLVRLAGARRDAESAKLSRLLAMLPELIEGGRRVLLFSQFTSMLALVEAALGPTGIPYVTLTGETEDRDTPVRRFQSGAVPLFLISLKAGGVGLNLTAADTVIIYDPWWNPAVEAQAIDRAHRIGQDKPVFVHRLVTLDTIEVKMQALQQRKAALAAGLFDPDRDGPLGITADDIEMLLGG